MNIYKFEVKKLWFSTFFWSIGIVGSMLLFIAFFPTMAADPDTMTVIMQNFPEEFLNFFGLNSDLPFNSILGYYAMTMQFVGAAIAIHAAYLGLSIISIEERELTADFLLTRPISRHQIYLSKVLSSITHMLILWAVIFANTLISVTLFSAGQSIDYSALVIYSLSIFLFQLSFLSIGIIISLVFPKFDNVITFSIAVGFGFFIISSMGEMLSMEWTKYLTPFGHYNPNMLLVDGFSVLLTVINLVITIACFYGSYVLYKRRNIHSI